MLSPYINCYFQFFNSIYATEGGYRLHMVNEIRLLIEALEIRKANDEKS